MNRRREGSAAGFTLIEMLIVVVILGILVTIASPKFSATKQKSFVATMVSDLRNVRDAQERYFSGNDDYYNGPIPNVAFDFEPTKNVTVTLESVSAAGWAATSSYSGGPQTCAIYYGAAAPPAPAVVGGVPACN